MPHAVIDIETQRAPQDALAYVADFSRSPEWDPSVQRARRLDDGLLGLGSRFELEVRAAGRTTTLVYEIVEWRVDRVVLLSRSDRLESRDTLTVTPRASGAVLRYDARLSALGLARVMNPVLALVFRGLASRAAEGLRTRLSDTSTAH